MKNHTRGRTCHSCMWAEQCASQQPCEYYYNAKADMELEMGREEQNERRKEFYEQWDILARENSFFSDP